MITVSLKSLQILQTWIRLVISEHLADEIADALHLRHDIEDQWQWHSVQLKVYIIFIAEVETTFKQTTFGPKRSKKLVISTRAVVKVKN